MPTAFRYGLTSGFAIRLWLAAGLAAGLAVLAWGGGALARPPDVEGWRAARWGMTAAELEDAFAGRLRRLPGRLDYREAYAERILPEVKVGGLAFTAYLQMSRDDGRLQQVLLERRNAAPSSYSQVLSDLRARLGPPARTCPAPSGGDRPGEVVWRFPTTTIHLTWFDLRSRGLLFYDPNRDRGVLERDRTHRRNNPRALPRRILLRYHPTGREDLAASCPPPNPRPIP